jgi:hypothetical protein
MDEADGVAKRPERAAKSQPAVDKNTPRKLRVVYRQGALHLREPLDFAEDTELEILLRPAPPR